MRWYTAIVNRSNQVQMPPSGPKGREEAWSDLLEEARKPRASATFTAGGSLVPLAEPKYRHIMLADLSSVPFNDPNELRRLLLTDPTLAAIYKLGVQEGYLRAEIDHRGART